MSNLGKLQGAFRYVLRIPPTLPCENVEYSNSPGGKQWDSLQHMVLCTVIEDSFDVIIEIDKVAKIRSFQDAVEVLTSLGIDFKE